MSEEQGFPDTTLGIKIVAVKVDVRTARGRLRLECAIHATGFSVGQRSQRQTQKAYTILIIVFF
jgi:hypothetical protein